MKPVALPNPRVPHGIYPQERGINIANFNGSVCRRRIHHARLHRLDGRIGDRLMPSFAKNISLISLPFKPPMPKWPRRAPPSHRSMGSAPRALSGQLVKHTEQELIGGAEHEAPCVASMMMGPGSASS
jgi:hypothetical protein